MPGSQVLDENGWDFLAIDDQCHFWVQTEAFGDVRTGALSVGQVEQLYETFRISHWGDYVGTYTLSFCDGPWWRFRFGSDLISVSSGCNARDTADRVQWLRDQVRATILSLHAAGAPVDGPVRYVLVTDPEANPSFDMYSNAPLWPLAAPAASVAVEQNDAYTGVPSRLATGDDAARLRAIAVSFRNGEIGRDWAGFAPVKDADGNLYGFFVRDTVPFEDDDGRWQ